MAADRKEATDIQAENERLKEENVRLQEKLNVFHGASRKHRARRARRFVAALLIILAVLFVAAGNLFFWFGNTLTKPDRFAEATSTIIKDPAVQQASAEYTTTQLYAQVDVQRAVENALPPRADFLAPQLTAQLRTFTQTGLENVFANPSFQDLWNQILQKQQQRLIRFATTYEGSGTVSLNDVFTQASHRLSGTKLSFLADKQLPAGTGNITIINVAWLPVLHQVVTHIDLWRALSVLLVIAALLAAIWLSANRRKAFYRFSLAVSGAMLLTLIGLRLVKSLAANKAEPQYVDGVRHALDAFLQPLRTQTITILALGAIAASVAWVTGSSPRAVRLRRQTSAMLNRAGNYLPGRENSFTKWLRAHKRAVEWSVVIATGVVLLFIHLTTASLLIAAAAMVVLIVLIELFASNTARAGPSRQRNERSLR